MNIEPKRVEVLFQIRESRPMRKQFGRTSDDYMPEVSLMERLLIEWEDGQWKVTNPAGDGHSSWVGRHESWQGAILDYLRERLAIPAPTESPDA